MILHGDCLQKLKEIPDNSVDSLVCDPPYGLSFMGKKWDYDVPSIEIWKECLRVLKPGGHALIACGTRTQHRMAVNIEDAGFEIRDVITWLYGSGFPKSLDISKAIDKAAGAEREVISEEKTPFKIKNDHAFDDHRQGWVDESGYRTKITTAPSTPEAKQWAGYGTALKPSAEFWTLARKPLSESTVAKNVLKWGCGGINIDACRVEANWENDPNVRNNYENNQGIFKSGGNAGYVVPKGRFPANLILDEVAGEMLDEQSGILKPAGNKDQASRFKKTSGGAFSAQYQNQVSLESGTGGASRFFYCAKASKSERNAGLENELKEKQGARPNSKDATGKFPDHDHRPTGGNNHPTVKPIKLMEYLIKLITPENGTVLDCFAGSGSTLVAAKRLGFKFIGIEREAEYIEIIKGRLNERHQVQAVQTAMEIA